MPPAHAYRRAPSYLTPSLLAVATIVSILMAVQIERPHDHAAIGAGSHPTTPVLSLRRVPEVLVGPAARARLAARLSAFLADSPGATCLVVEADGVPAFAQQPDDPMTPASLMKLSTGAAVIDRLGADTRLHTVVRSAAAVDSHGVVNGDLYLVGGGDPLLMTDDYFAALERPPSERTSLEALADAVVAAGVRSITGRVVGDESRYDSVRYNAAWAASIINSISIGPMSALTLNGGLDEYPPSPDQHQPRHASRDPALTAAERFTALLQQRGVAIAAPAATGVAPAQSVAVTQRDSAPVRDLVKEMLRESDNLTAELLGKELGLQRGDGGTTDAGVAQINDVMAARGLTANGIERVDASGLATADKETCALVQHLLDAAKPGDPLNDGLSVAAQTGTLADKFGSSPVAGRLRAKTGTLDVVTALAGYLTTARGADITFSYIVNVSRPQRITTSDVKREETLAAILDTYPEAPPIAALEPKAPPP